MKVLTIVFILFTKVFAQQIYTMQDLKILASQKEYTEYLNHAKDITPSKRNKKWNALTLKVGLDYLKSLAKIKSSQIPAKDKILIKEISKWPIFKDDESFKINKRPIITKSFSVCLDSELEVNECISEHLKLYQKDLDPELGLKLINKLNSNRPMSFKKEKVIPFIRPMLASNICIYYINKSPLKEILDSSNIQINDLYLTSKIDRDCRKSLSKKIMQNLYKTDDNYLRKNSKAILQRWGLLHSNDIYYYNIAQFLSDYKFPKELILTKWKTLRTLGKNNSLREIILAKLTSKRPLYGKILYNNSNESKAIISAIKRYIPEYFVDYANICINYFKGNIKAPSTDCHQLFKRSKELELFSTSKQLQYNQIMSSWKKKG